MSDIPQQSMGMTDEEEAKQNDLDEDKNKDVRTTQYRKDKMVVDEDGYVSH
jgi:histone deacetylase 1/2